MRSVVLLVAVLAIGGYFAWNEWQGPAGQAQLDECHRMAGRAKAQQERGGTVDIAELTAKAQACSASFGEAWARDTSAHAVAMRAEGAASL